LVHCLTNNSTLKIGYTFDNYQQQKNIIGKVTDCQYFRLKNYYISFLKRIQFIPFLSIPYKHKLQDSDFKFRDFDLNKVDVIHLYNSVSYGRTPWVSTYETIIPRFSSVLLERTNNLCLNLADSEVRLALDMLAGSACKQIIARSHNSILMQNEFLDLFPEYENVIKSKQIVIPMGQPLLSNKSAETAYHCNLNRPIRFMFVGNYFFSKGGREILSVLDEVRRKENINLELIIVSNLTIDNYASNANEEDLTMVEKFIDANATWISFYQSIPFHKVSALMESCDVGLLPSYADTYGFSVLEFQASGCPVITTDIRAFPEINNAKIGWIINVPKWKNGEAKYKTKEERDDLSDAIITGLRRYVYEIIENPEVIFKKGQYSIERIKREHDPEIFSNRLLKVYQEALGGVN